MRVIVIKIELTSLHGMIAFSSDWLLRIDATGFAGRNNDIGGRQRTARTNHNTESVGEVVFLIKMIRLQPKLREPSVTLSQKIHYYESDFSHVRNFFFVPIFTYYISKTVLPIL